MPHILVVEDSRTQAEELRQILETAGFTAEVVPSGTAALARLRDAAFDLVLSDVLMPDLSGYDLCRHIKTDPRTKQIPVVLLTQLADPLDILLGLECGADNFITKPFDANHLLNRLRTILANRVPRTPGAPAAGTLLSFRGRGVTITSDKEQILDLLLATVEEAALARAREREARAEAETLAEAGRRRDRYLAMLAHELRGPLAPLLTSLHVLREGGADPAVRVQSLDRMERQVRHLSRLLGELLDAARVIEGKVTLNAERLDLARLVRTTAEDRRAVLEQAGLALAVETPETPLWVKGEATRLAQVLGNLLDNATCFTPRGGRVTVQLAAGEQGSAVLTVADSGAGIAPEILPQLFEPFAQGEQGLERQAGGLGLGLVMVRRLAELHGGAAAASSAGKGKGATFTVRLPLAEEPTALAASSPPTPTVTHLRILVIEDNKDAADSLKLLLGVCGHEVRVAYTGPAGVQEATDWLPDAVLSDIGLPGLDGFEVARKLRQLPGLARARMVALTGYGADEDRRRGLEAGFDAFLVKPAEPDTIQRALTAPL